MFESIEKLPADPILGLTTAFNQDSNPKKIDLGAGVYKDETGNTPIFAAVKQAEAQWQQQEQTKVYIPQTGFPEFNERILNLLFGKDHAVLREKRAASVLTPGGSGGLRVTGELINRCQAGGTLWVSQPTWGNHTPLLGSTGLRIREYPYYDNGAHRVRFEEMLGCLEKAEKQDTVLIHGCCHNPTGADLTRDQWRAMAELAADRGFLPFVDLAYQGLADGLEEDAFGVRTLADTVPEMVVAYSCSKNFGLYRERSGAAITVAGDSRAAEAGATHLINIARQMYSMPPAHGGAIVMMILGTPELFEQWRRELDAMRMRINDLRTQLADTLAQKNAPMDFGFIRDQRGMFSLLGISKEQVLRLRSEFSIYIVDSGRMNIAGINPESMDYLTDAIIAVL